MGQLLVPISIGDKRLHVEIAADPGAMSRGLSGRDALGQDQGMLFVLPKDRGTSFWMRDTRIPLSIAFISEGGSIISIHDLTPLDETPVRAPSGCAYAIEANLGWFNDIMGRTKQ
jgi:uncharacterized membrane protein (UPF0127 family)